MSNSKPLLDFCGQKCNNLEAMYRIYIVYASNRRKIMNGSYKSAYASLMPY